MRKLAGHRPGTKVTYIPEADNNRAEDEPIKIIYREPTERDRRRLMAAGEELKIHMGPDGKPQHVETTSTAHLDRQAVMIEALVESVEHFEIEYRDGVFNVTTGKELVDHGGIDLISEVFGVLSGSLELTGDEKKELPWSSELPTRTTEGSSGTVENAEHEASTSNATVSLDLTQGSNTLPSG
jgi:hypothetical protein